MKGVGEFLERNLPCTIGMCVSGSYAAGVAGGASGCLLGLPSGHVASGSFNAGPGGIGADLSGGAILSNAKSGADLAKESGTFGFSAGVGRTVTVNGSLSSQGIWSLYVGGGVGGNFSGIPPAPFSVNGGASCTWVTPTLESLLGGP